MKVLFGEQCRILRNALGLSQAYMATRLGMNGQRAFSRFEHGEGLKYPQQREAVAHELGFSSAESLCAFDIRKAIALYEAYDGLAAKIREQEAEVARLRKEREQLRERVSHLEEEVLDLRKSGEFLREELKETRMRH